MIQSQTIEVKRAMAGAIDGDVWLIHSFVGGDVEAFDRIFLKYQDYVYNICLGILGNPEDARDGTQETFLRVYRSAGQFRGKSALSTWIYTIAVNTCRQMLRKRPKAGVVSLDEPDFAELTDPGPPPWREVERADEERRVRRLVAELPEDYRIVLVLRYFQELSYEEMVRVLNWTLPQVKIKLHRARRAFATRYARLQEGSEGRS
jgi:RNA polymerase sigma-70 factor (ECF subfamily)